MSWYSPAGSHAMATTRLRLPCASVDHWLLRATAMHPERPAVGALTYAELERRARRHAGALIERGVAPGNRVGIALPAGPDFLAALHGSFLAGAVAVPASAGPRRRSLDPDPQRDLRHNRGAPRALRQRRGAGRVDEPRGADHARVARPDDARAPPGRGTARATFIAVGVARRRPDPACAA